MADDIGGKDIMAYTIHFESRSTEDISQKVKITLITPDDTYHFDAVGNKIRVLYFYKVDRLIIKVQTDEIGDLSLNNEWLLLESIVNQMDMLVQVAFVVDKGLTGELVESIATLLRPLDVAILGLIGYKPRAAFSVHEFFRNMDHLFLADISSNCLTNGFIDEIIHLIIFYCSDMDFTQLINENRDRLFSFQYFTTIPDEYKRMHKIINTDPSRSINRVLLHCTDNDGDVMIHERPSPDRNLYRPLPTTVQTTNFNKVLQVLSNDRLFADGNEKILKVDLLNITKFTASDDCTGLQEFLQSCHEIHEVIINVTDNTETMQKLWEEISLELFDIPRSKIYSTNESNEIVDQFQLYEEKWIAEVKSGQSYQLPLRGEAIYIKYSEMEKAKLMVLAKDLTLLKRVIYLDLLYADENLFYYIYELITEENIEITNENEIIWPNIEELTVVFNVDQPDLYILYRHRDNLKIIRFLIKEDPLDLSQLQTLGGNIAICTNGGAHETGRNVIVCTRK